MTLETIAQQIRDARKAKGYSQRKLAELTGMPQNHISRIENGLVDIRLSSLTDLADVLGMDISLNRRAAEKREGTVNLLQEAVEKSRSTFGWLEESPLRQFRVGNIVRQSKALPTIGGTLTPSSSDQVVGQLIPRSLFVADEE